MIPKTRRNGMSGQSQSNGSQVQFSCADYQSDGFYDEMFDEAGQPRADCQPLYDRIRSISADDLIRRQQAADRSMVQLGITFNVYGDRQGPERIIPFDIVPRIIPQRRVGLASSAGCGSGLSRSTCLSTISITSSEIVARRRGARARGGDGAPGFRKQCVGLTPPRGIWCHITGTDLVRDTRRPDLRAGRQSALPVGRVVRAAESAVDEADVSAVVRADGDPAGR